jgi:hypothetical protein
MMASNAIMPYTCLACGDVLKGHHLSSRNGSLKIRPPKFKLDGMDSLYTPYPVEAENSAALLM